MWAPVMHLPLIRTWGWTAERHDGLQAQFQTCSAVASASHTIVTSLPVALEGGDREIVIL
jgi:hypothetical protein